MFESGYYAITCQTNFSTLKLSLSNVFITFVKLNYAHTRH